jgi:hypothetical protein
MEIVLATAALDYGLIEGRIYVALGIMALMTTMISGLALPWLMKTRPLSLAKISDIITSGGLI